MLLLIIGYAGWASAGTPVKTSSKTPPVLVMTDHQGRGLQLEVQQMRWPQVLDALADKTHIPIHYSALPEGLVTASCAGVTFKEALECLLDHKADLIVRYPGTANPTTRKFQIAEVWIVGTRLDGTVAKDFPASANMGRQDQDAGTGRIGQLLEKAQSPHPEERADAMGALLAESRTGDLVVTAALEQALTDADAGVRSQAISSYAHHEGGAAVTQAIREAMNDNSADVRMMAVDSITNDVELLQQAANDSDETIRNLATLKLEALATLGVD